ncbi:hypothetical protein FRC17_010015 [Serendipita sp. 399]|nr:hypothetical protein FRC17_010015 [Serendipita sp. 399]
MSLNTDDHRHKKRKIVRVERESENLRPLQKPLGGGGGAKLALKMGGNADEKQRRGSRAQDRRPSKNGPESKKKSVLKNGTMNAAAQLVGGSATATTNDTVVPNSSRRLIVVAGSYEKILYGLEIEPQKRKMNGEDERADFTPVFAFPAHISCVKAVAASRPSGKWLATGGTDETIKIWDLRRRKELGTLQQHQGSITQLSFPTRTHLISTSEDGTICVYHTRDWAVLATLRGHKGRVNDVAVHPSAKVCLSVGKDRTLRMWDLMRGKGSGSVKLGKEGEVVRWLPSGTRIAVVSESALDIYSTKMAMLQTIRHSTRIQDLHFCRAPNGRELGLVAAEDKLVTVYLMPPSVEDGEGTSVPVVATLIGHINRVKAIESITIQNTTYATSVSSDGQVHLYDLTNVLAASAQSDPLAVHPLAVYDTKGSRLTCVTVTDCGDVEMTSSTGLQRKRKQSEASDDEEVYAGQEDDDEEEEDGDEEDEEDDEGNDD